MRRPLLHFVGPHVDDLHDPVGIGAAGRCEQVRDRLAGEAQRLLERLGLIHEHVGARGSVTLVVDQPLAPAGILGAGRQRRPLAIRHRLRRIGDVFVVALAAGRGRIEAEPAAGQQEQRARFLRAAVAADLRPGIVLAPLVGARLVDQHARRRRARCILQIVIEERLHHRAAEPASGVAFELDRADAAAFAPALAVIPRPEHEVQPLAARILRCERLEQRRAAVDVFLIEQSRRRSSSARSAVPSRAACRLPGSATTSRSSCAPRAHARSRADRDRAPSPVRRRSRRAGTCRTRRTHPTTICGRPCARLLVVRELERAELAERAVVEPVVAHPAIDHRRERHRDLQRRMRMHDRHDGRVALVRAAERADAAVATPARSSPATRSCRSSRSRDRLSVGFAGPRSGRVIT